MPQKSVSKAKQDYWSRKVLGSSPMRSVFNYTGMQSKPEWPLALPENPYAMVKLFADENMDWYSGDPNWDCRTSIGSLTRWQGPYDGRLYAGVYQKATQAARNGAELGMNAIQYKLALRTFLDSSLLGATLVTTFVQANQIGLRALRARPNLTPAQVRREIRKKRTALGRLRAADSKRQSDTSRVRRRLKNELFILMNIASTLLAYRYGFAPIMSDLFKSHKILTTKPEGAAAARAWASKSFSVKPLSDTWFVESYAGKERCSVKFAATVDNPDVWQANRLGLLNPQFWLWDKTPWSFVVDWWFPVGDFLGSFTATLGLTYNYATVTQSRTFTGSHSVDYWGMKWAGTLWGRTKDRTVSTDSLPFPFALAYGRGMGIERGQNALALITQKLNPALKRAVHK